MWGIIFLIFLLLFIVSIIYLVTKINKFKILEKYQKTKKGYLISAGILFVACVALYFMFGATSLVLILVHLTVFFIMCELLSKVFRKLNSDKKYYVGVIAIAITVVYFSVGWFYAHHVYETTYNIKTSKSINSLKIVQISDSHVGATFDGDGFISHADNISKNVKDVDLIVITGDFVDDGTTKEDMIKSCRAIGSLKSKYGTYFIYGNHDRGYYSKKNFTEKELITELKKYDVTILEDKSVLVDNKFYIVGRADYSTRPNRKSMKALMKRIDTSKYVLVLDHEPTDYDLESKEKIDLVLSGHTHGGQMIPIGFISEKLMKANDRTYGIETRNGTTFIVSSGISDWDIPFKTGTIAEYVVITVKSK